MAARRCPVAEPHPQRALRTRRARRSRRAAVTISGDALTTDYNAFAGPQTARLTPTGARPRTDLSFSDASGAQLTAPPTGDFDLFDEATIWNRTTSVRGHILANSTA